MTSPISPEQYERLKAWLEDFLLKSIEEANLGRDPEEIQYHRSQYWAIRDVQYFLTDLEAERR